MPKTPLFGDLFPGSVTGYQENQSATGDPGIAAGPNIIQSVDQVNAEAAAATAGVDPIGSVTSGLGSLTSGISGSLNEATATIQGGVKSLGEFFGIAFGSIIGLAVVGLVVFLIIKSKV